MRANPEQIERAARLVGRRVRFAHQPEERCYRVLRASVDGLVEIEQHAGLFAPHLFVVVHDGRDS